MGMMFDKLSDSDKNMISNYIESYAFAGEEGSMHATLEYILRFWDQHKSENLDKIFGGQLILEKEVSYVRSTEELEGQMNQVFFDYSANDTDAYKFVREFHSIFEDKVYSDNLSEDEKRGYWAAKDLVSTYTLTKNEYSGETVSIKTPDGKEMKIPHGCRATRMIGKIATAFHVDEKFEAFRIAHSMVLNQKTLKGNLCLSIHPMDYMTMSDNNCDWESCMSWQNNGCYRMGTVEMMNSPVTIVAYLTSKDGMMVPGGYDWNSKKWRELYIVSPNILTNVKSYPYHNEFLTREVLKWIKELVVAADLGWKYDEDITPWFYDEQGDVERFKENEIRIYPETYEMYNDFESNCPQFSFIREDLQGVTYVNYSGETECMSCGCTGGSFDGEGALCCDDCDEVSYCSECDTRLYNDDDTYHVDGETLCEYCFDNKTFESIYSGDRHMNYNGIQLRIAADETLSIKGRKVYYENGWRDRGERDMREGDIGSVVYMNVCEECNLYDDEVDEAIKLYSTTGKYHTMQVSNYNPDILYVYMSEVTDRFAQDLGYENAEALRKELEGSMELLVA